MGVALAWDAAEDLEGVDFDALGFEAGTRESMMNQLNTLVASFYLDGLDFFGVYLYIKQRRVMFYLVQQQKRPSILLILCSNYQLLSFL